MNVADLEALLQDVARGRLTPPDALSRLRAWPFEDVGIARIDHQRELRCGMPEVIFGGGKTPAQVAEIFARQAASGANVLATRVDSAAAEAARALVPAAQYDAGARVLTLRQRAPAEPAGSVCVVSAGTSDLPVACEAQLTIEMLDQRCTHIGDVGVAGLHRLLAVLDELRGADAVVVVAGMEGALPSVVGGLVDRPIIGVPTSVGYGASFAGLAALLAMLNSCAAGVTVVNIDNGFGAGVHAAKIARRAARE